MTVAVLSDIHSNYHAFKACYEDALAQGADSFLFLGDYISDLAEPRKTLDLVYEIQSRYPTVCLRGNRERYMLEFEKGLSIFQRGSKSGSLLFTYDLLRKKDLDFFRGLKISDTVKIGGLQIEIAHATMDDDKYYFDCQDGHTAVIFPRMKCRYLLTGHSHKQYIKSHYGKTIINPGSVGIPQRGCSWPSYALLEISNGTIQCTMCQVRYDIRDVIHAQFESGLVDYAKYWAIGILYDILTGEEWVLKLLTRVQGTGDIYDESVWHNAASELGMKFTEQEIMELYNGSRGKEL